jgi:sugar lactone lactonase YvrE
MREVSRLADGGAFFEGPRWHEGRWWVSDFFGRAVSTVEEDGRIEEVMTVEQQASGLGWMPDGSLLVVSMLDHRVLRRSQEGEVSVHAEVGEYCGGALNDMVVDSGGRAYAGDFGFDIGSGADAAPTNLVRVDPDGSVQIAAEDLWSPNGTVITADGSTLIVGESLGSRYTAFTIEDDGSLSDRRVWGKLGPAPEPGRYEEMLPQLRFGPDGCTLDAEGHIWSADAVGSRCCRLAPGGSIVEEIPAPDGLGIFACMLGGADGRTLLMCAAPDFMAAAAGARDGVLLTTRVDVPHAGLP